jgi:hypothetical protein
MQTSKNNSLQRKKICHMAKYINEHSRFKLQDLGPTPEDVN